MSHNAFLWSVIHKLGLLVVVLLAGLHVASRVDFSAKDVEEDKQPDGPPGSGIIVHTDVTKVWLPKSLFDLARRQSGTPAFGSHRELRAYLDRTGQRAARYVVTFRHRQVNGLVSKITQIRTPGASPEYFGEFQDVMATASGKVPESSSVDYAGARVGVIPAALFTAEPADLVHESLDQPDPTADERP